MMKVFLVLFSVLIWTSSTIASERPQVQEVKDGAHHWVITLERQEGLDTLIFREKNFERTLTFQTDSVAHGFIRLSTLTFSKNGDLHFVTIWNKGAHGETIRVFNSQASDSKSMEVFSYNSAWPLEYDYKDGVLTIYGKGDMGDDGIPASEVKTFKP